MDVQSALEALGIDESAELTSDQLRRTYMRKLREHPPERDPEGFKRVRAAYECLQLIGAARHLEALARDGKVEWVELPKEPEPATDDPADLAEGEPVNDGDDLETVIDQILGHLEQKDHVRAAELERAWLDRQTHGWIWQDTLVRWLLTRELIVVTPKLPKRVIGAICRGIRARDLGEALHELEQFRELSPPGALGVKTILYREARNLHDLIGHVLGPPRASTQETRRETRKRIISLIGVVVVAAIIALLKRLELWG